MKTLLAAALVFSANSQDETSLMQGLARRVDGKLGADPSPKTARSDATAQLMETATKMLKNGAGVTPDVVTFIAAARNDIQGPMQDIVDAHVADSAALMAVHEQFQPMIDAYELRVAAIATEMAALEERQRLHQLCRKDESIDCGWNRECEEKMFIAWRRVKTHEQTLREIHREIHHEWCVVRVEGEWSPIGDPWGWTDETQYEGAETSQSVVHYPIIDHEDTVRTFRGWSVTKFPEYKVAKTAVEEAWTEYNLWVLQCAERDATYEAKTEVCDALQDTMSTDDCTVDEEIHDSGREFGIAWHAHLEHYYSFWDTIQLKVHDRQREWETLKIVDCLLETVYTHVIHSIETDEPCPTDSSHPAQTESEINQCHVISYVTTDNLTICSDESYDPPTEEHLTFSDGSLDHVELNHALTINYNVADDTNGADYDDSLERGVRCHNNINSHPDGLCHWAHPLGSVGFHISDECAVPAPPVIEIPPVICSNQYVWDTTGSFSADTAGLHTAAWGALGVSCTGVAIHDDTLLTAWEGGDGGRAAHMVSESCYTHLSPAGWAGCAAPKVCLHGTCNSGPALADPAYMAMSQQCKLHEQHLDLGELDRDTFRCLNSWCTPASARCNGVTNCHDGSDEVGCDTIWETPAFLNVETECPSDTSADVHFTCSSGHCVPVESRCNGQSNCNDGSDEQGCAVSMDGVTLEATSGHMATLETLTVDGTVFHDREYTFDSLGSFTGMHFVKTHNNDKFTDSLKVQMKLRLPQPMSVYITHSHGRVAPWLLQDGWTEVPTLTGVGYSGIHETRQKETSTISEWQPLPLETDVYTAGPVFHKFFQAGLVSLPGNGHNDGEYLTFLAHPNQLPTHEVAPAPVSATGEDRFIGCFRDNGARDLGAMQSGSGGAYNTFPLCHARCSSLGNAFMSLQYGGECFCADSYGAQSGSTVYTQNTAAGACAMTNAACHAGNSFSCGGTWEQAIYRVASVPADYAMVHDGHCASGWISGSNTLQPTISACSERCRSNANCGYFAFAQESGSSTNCALYTADGGCADDNNFVAYNAYQMLDVPTQTKPLCSPGALVDIFGPNMVQWHADSPSTSNNPSYSVSGHVLSFHPCSGNCRNSIPVVTADIILPCRVAAISGSYVQQSTGSNAADDCNGSSQPHDSWYPAVTNHDGYVMFGTPDQVIVGGCSHGVNFGTETTPVARTELGTPTDTLRFAGAQSVDDEHFAIDLSGLQIE